MSRSKICEICSVRPATEEMNGQAIYCYPCSTMADMENHHSDWSHDVLLETPDAKLTLKGWTFKTKSALLDWAAEERKIMETCWVCHPELDESQREYVVRTGTSRAGIVLTTPQRVTGRQKAEVVRGLLEEAGHGADVRVSYRKGTTTLKIRSYVMTWEDHRGISRGTGGSHTDAVTGKVRKIRNVSELLRMLAAE